MMDGELCAEPLAVNEGGARVAFHRPLRATLRRHGWLIAAIVCVLCVGWFLLAPRLGRTYALAGDASFKVRPFEKIPELAALPETVLNEIAPAARNAGLRITWTRAGGESGNAGVLHLAAVAPLRDTALVRLQSFADQYGTLLRDRAEDLAAGYHAGLLKRQAALTDEESALIRGMETFRITNPNGANQGADAVRAEFENLSGRREKNLQQQAEVKSLLEESEQQMRPGASLVETQPLVLATTSTLPRSPGLWSIYLVGFGGACVLIVLLALALHQTDGTFHSAGEVAMMLDAPLVGCVSEIRGPAGRKWDRAWRLVRPVMGTALLLAVLGSAVVCYRNLADAEYHAGAAGRSLDFATVSTVDRSSAP